jgi:hypothetical protein
MEPIQDDRPMLTAKHTKPIGRDTVELADVEPRTISDDATLVEWACGASSPSPAAHEALIRILHRMGDLETQVESLREERELDVRVATWEVRFNALEAERDRLKEKADYWERQYVIESENADDFHAERDRLREERGICAVCLRNQGTQGLVYINKAMYDDVLAERDRLIQALERVKDHAILVMAPQSVVDMIDEALTKKREA